jgi:hypothetical protein
MFKSGTRVFWIGLGISLLLGCGPSQYAVLHQDSVIVKALQANNMSPELIASRVAAVVNMEIAVGKLDYTATHKFLDDWEAKLAAGEQYADLATVINTFASRYLKGDDAVSQAVLIAYYLFAPDITTMLDMHTNIAQPDIIVLQDLIAYLRTNIHVPLL